MTAATIALAVLLLAAFAAGLALAASLRAALMARREVNVILAASAAPSLPRIIEEPLPEVEAEPESEPELVLAPNPEPEPGVMPPAQPELFAAPPSGPQPRRPKGLPAPRLGRADALTEISGLSPREERMLHRLGIYHLGQVAIWGELEVLWLDQHFALEPGTAAAWSAGARALTSSGKLEAFPAQQQDEAAADRPELPFRQAGAAQA